MTMADAEAAPAGAPAAQPVPPPPGVADAVAAAMAVPRGCPFLLSEGGGWRLDLPSREHRCAAVVPPAPLAPEKQARLCLTAAHTNCATYLASTSAREARLGTEIADRTTRWGLARTTTVIEDPGGLRARLLGLLLDRRRWPAIPAVLLVTTLFTLAISGFRADDSTSAAATASPAQPTTEPVVTAPPTATPPAESPTSPPTTAPSPTAAATPTPAATTRTYRVKSGDTLSSIASKYGTTPRAIADLNDISVNSILHVGQVLKIPT